jgi:hypothetical protein
MKEEEERERATRANGLRDGRGSAWAPGKGPGRAEQPILQSRYGGDTAMRYLLAHGYIEHYPNEVVNTLGVYRTTNKGLEVTLRNP